MSSKWKRLTAAVGLLACGLVVAVEGPASGIATRPTDVAAWRPIVFPVQEPVSYSDTWGACRDGCTRHHIGTDVIGKRLYHMLAATDSTVTFMRTDAAGTGGNWLVLRDVDGWYYEYGHINNDTPGTDDGKNPPAWQYAPGLHVGSKVSAGQFVAYMGDSGNAETSVPHLHFEIHMPDHTPVNPYPSLRLAQGKQVFTIVTRCLSLATPKLLADVNDPTRACTAVRGKFTTGRGQLPSPTTGRRVHRMLKGPGTQYKYVLIPPPVLPTTTTTVAAAPTTVAISATPKPKPQP